MKKLLLIAILMLTIVFAAVACKDNTSKPADTTVEDGTTAEPTTTVAPETTAEPETTITETTAEETTVPETTAPETTAPETTVEETTAEETTAEETTAEETEPETEAETVAVPDDATNVALGGRVTTPNYWSIYGNNFYPWFLNDGVGGNNSWYCNQGTPAGELYATIDLGNVYTLYQIKLANPCWNAFPDAYELQVSLDGSTWTTVASATGMTAKAEASGVVVHGLTAAVEAKYVRLQILAHAPSDNPVSGIGEFEVYGIYAREPGVKVPEGATNVALGATVTAPTAEINTGTWAAENLVDGSWDTLNDTNSKLGWTSPVLEMPPDDLRVLLELEEMCTLYRITLYPMQWDQGTGFPKGYELWVSEDGEDWTMVASASGVDASAASDTAVTPIVHYLDEAVRAKYFALKITEHSARRWDGVPHSAIGEIELTGVSDKKDMITTDKYSYGAGEAINVTAMGFGTDEVKLFLKADFEAGNFDNYIYRYSVGFDSGKTVNILDAEANPSMVAYHAVPAGEYVVAIVNVGGTVIDSKKIIVDGSIDVEEPETDVEVNEGFVDVPAGATNVALQGTVTATNYWFAFGTVHFYPSYLNDGAVNDSTSWYCNDGTPAGELYVTIDLGGVYTLYQIKLANACWNYFPDDYELQVSLDGGTWTTVVSATGMAAEGEGNGVVVHGLTAAVNAKYVRLQILKHSTEQNLSGLGEFEVYGIYLGDPEVETEPEEDPYMGVNLAPFGQVTVPNYWEIYGNNFYPSYLNDGRWPADSSDANSWYCLPYTTAGELYVTLELGGVSMIDRIVLGAPCWGNFPDAYELQVSMDGNRWTTVATASNMATEGAEKGAIHNLTMPVRAKYVRLQILAHTPEQTNSGLGEFEVWGVCEESLNVARQGQVTVPNYWSIYGNNFYPWFLNDGVGGNNSWYCIDGTPVDQVYVMIDLGSVYALDKIVLKNPCWNQFPNDYELQVSMDGNDWTPVASATGMSVEAEANGEVVHSLTGVVKAKYVRLQVLGYASGQTVCGLGEFEVWGKPVAN